MKLHRLVLTNYRGIARREIEFPDHGVVVVSGANEIGKTSMIESLDLLLESKDRSTKKEVKQVKPTNADVGSEVIAEISTGAYRFIYRKKFHKKCETELTVLAPRREQLTGDEAHDRVRAMLADTVDTELWRAQRVLQAASTAEVDLSGCNALSRALDIAAANSDTGAALSGTEPLLVDRIDAAYARYFTSTGRPTGEWAAAITRLTDAKVEVAACETAMAEVDDRVRRHAELTEQVAHAARQCSATAPRLRAAQDAADRAAKIAEQVREAKLIAAAAVATSAQSTAKHAGRLALINEIATRATAIATVAAAAQQAASQQLSAAEEAGLCDAAVGAAARVLAAAEQRAETARLTLERIADRDEADRLHTRLSKIDDLQRIHDRIGKELDPITLTDESLRRIENAATAVDRVGDQLEMISAVVEFTAVADIELVVGDQRASLPAGQTWSVVATGPTDVDVPGVLTARVTPGPTALDVQARYLAAQQDLAAALAAGGVADLAGARTVDQRRRDLQRSRDQLKATLDALSGDEPVDQLRARLAGLNAQLPAEPDLFATDSATARAELDAAETARKAAAAQYEAQRQAATAVARRLAETTTQATVLQNDVSTRRAELDAAAARLAAERVTAGDGDLASTADAERQVAQAAERRVAELGASLAAEAPDQIAAELKAAADEADSRRASHHGAVRALQQVSIELSVCGSEGRKSRLDAAEIECEHATSQHVRVGGRARAAQLLRSVMARHRDATRLRYVEPYRAELQRLGRPVFGPSFEVDVDSDLCIRSRTLNDVTVPYESLSGGAREQLGILARLASAALVAKEDSVPVVIDDALGFTDPQRLARMSQVFDSVGEQGQVIVLTCSPGRYDDVTAAHRIDLNA